MYTNIKRKWKRRMRNENDANENEEEEEEEEEDCFFLKVGDDQQHQLSLHKDKHLNFLKQVERLPPSHLLFWYIT